MAWPNNSPGLYLDSTTNQLKFVMSTFALYNGLAVTAKDNADAIHQVDLAGGDGGLVVAQWFEGPEQPVPEERDRAVVAVEVAHVLAMMDAVVRREICSILAAGTRTYSYLNDHSQERHQQRLEHPSPMIHKEWLSFQSCLCRIILNKQRAMRVISGGSMRPEVWCYPVTGNTGTRPSVSHVVPGSGDTGGQSYLRWWCSISSKKQIETLYRDLHTEDSSGHGS